MGKGGSQADSVSWEAECEVRANYNGEWSLGVVGDRRGSIFVPYHTAYNAVDAFARGPNYI
jgi:hypothetical protein